MRDGRGLALVAAGTVLLAVYTLPLLAFAEREASRRQAMDLEERARRLDGWLELAAAEERASRLTLGITETTAGTLFVGVGLWLALDDGSGNRPDWLMPMALGVGAYALGEGLTLLATAGAAERSLLGWRLAQQAGVTDGEVLEHEEALRSAAEIGFFGRMWRGALALAVTAAGASVMLATGLSSVDDQDAVYGWSTGAALVGAGLLAGALNFLVPSSAERAWRAYRRGEEPRVLTGSVVVAPSATADGGGLSVAGAF